MALTIKNEDVRQQALAALSGMGEVVRNDMLVRGTYISDDVINPKLADTGAICGGRKACAVGSLWLGAGVKVRTGPWGDKFLPGTEADKREGYLARRPGLRLAYTALNDAADRYCERNGIDLDAPRGPNGEDWYVSPERFGSMERLFEAEVYPDATTGAPLLDVAELPKIIKSAREAIKRA